MIRGPSKGVAKAKSVSKLVLHYCIQIVEFRVIGNQLAAAG